MKTIEYKVSFEKMISRLPGLFAYLDWDEYGEVSLHKATDSLNGCWGKVVENIKLPDGVNLLVKTTHILRPEEYLYEDKNHWYDIYGDKIVYDKEDVNKEVTDYKLVLNSGEVYSYRTLIDYYYQYKANDPNTINTYYVHEENEDLIIPLEDYETLPESTKKHLFLKKNSFLAFIEKGIGKIEVDFEGKKNTTPKFIFLSNVKRIYNELVKMKKMCDFYNDNLDRGLTEKDAHLCCLCEKYEELGGDAFKNYVFGLIPEAEQRAEEFKGYAEDAEEAQDKNKEMTIDFDIDLVSTYQDFGIMTPYAPIWLPCKRYKVGDDVEYNGELYRCIEENTGKWDEDLMTVVFDESKFKKVDAVFIDMFCDDETDVENNEYNFEKKTISSVGEIWYNGEAIKHMAMERNIGEEIRDYDIELPFPIKITGGTDSKLVNMRRFVTYYNDDGIAERPIVGEDWLFYYRKGLVVNIKTINDNLGNVSKLSSVQERNMVEPSEDPNDLAAYGDVIEDIKPSEDPMQNTITFIYRVGVHLKSEENPTIVYDDDNNKLIKWRKFVWDKDDKTGIKYTETYNYEQGGDLYALVNTVFTPKDENDEVISTFTFDRYINGEYDEMLPSYKFEFTTMNNTFSYDKTIAHQDVNIISLLTDYEVYRKDFDEFTESKIIRDDYFNGVTYKPTKDIDVHIERGSTSVFDKHIAFGEIKTLDDLVDYKNGSFFPITES